ncbi:MAG: hypothetical protein ACLPRE_02330 [Limisphaerales bacterium]
MRAIKMLLDAGHIQPALIVLYTAIDIFASLRRLETETDTNGNYFKKWIDDYMIAGLQRPFSSEDLWGARCGLLHTHTASSKASRQSKAQQLHYYRADGIISPDQQRAFDSMARIHGKQFVDVDLLYADFIQGLRRFSADIQGNPKLAKRVFHHSATLFSCWSSDE